MRGGDGGFEEKRVETLIVEISDDIDAYGPVRRSSILDEYREDLPYAIMALDQGPFYEGDDGKVHVDGDTQ